MISLFFEGVLFGVVPWRSSLLFSAIFLTKEVDIWLNRFEEGGLLLELTAEDVDMDFSFWISLMMLMPGTVETAFL
jgi:hypothetical protein